MIAEYLCRHCRPASKFYIIGCCAEVLKGNGKLIPQVTKLWVERIEKGPEPAMVELLTMLFEVTWKLFIKKLL